MAARSAAAQALESEDDTFLRYGYPISRLSAVMKV
jgi:hypothetical protein